MHIITLHAGALTIQNCDQPRSGLKADPALEADQDFCVKALAIRTAGAREAAMPEEPKHKGDGGPPPRTATALSTSTNSPLGSL
jgi:hypothetical protein